MPNKTSSLSKILLHNVLIHVLLTKVPDQRLHGLCLSDAYFFVWKANPLDKPPIEATYAYKPWLVYKYRSADAIFHIRATQSLHLENIFRIEAMAC